MIKKKKKKVNPRNLKQIFQNFTEKSFSVMRYCFSLLERIVCVIKLYMYLLSIS